MALRFSERIKELRLEKKLSLYADSKIRAIVKKNIQKMNLMINGSDLCIKHIHVVN